MLKFTIKTLLISGLVMIAFISGFITGVITDNVANQPQPTLTTWDKNGKPTTVSFDKNGKPAFVSFSLSDIHTAERQREAVREAAKAVYETRRETFKRTQAETVTPHGKIVLGTVEDFGDKIGYRTEDGKLWRADMDKQADGSYRYGLPEEIETTVIWK